MNLAKLSAFARSAVNTFSDGGTALAGPSRHKIDTDLVQALSRPVPTTQDRVDWRIQPTSKRTHNGLLNARCGEHPEPRLRNIAMIPHYELPDVTDLYSIRRSPS